MSFLKSHRLPIALMAILAFPALAETSKNDEAIYLRALPGLLAEIWETNQYIQACWNRYEAGDLVALKALYFMEKGVALNNRIVQEKIDLLSSQGTLRQKMKDIKNFHKKFDDIQSLQNVPVIAAKAQKYCMYAYQEMADYKEAH